jgi:hypothetical protein
MLSWVDCLSLCELSADEVRAIAEHEHIPEIAAMELGNWLVVTPDGRRMIKRMILEDIEGAVARGNHVRAAHLKLAMKHFCSTHPENPDCRT